jgi:hypothetical protein
MAAVATVAAPACGGKVVLDGSGSTGSGTGAGGAGVVTTGGSGASGCYPTPPPPSVAFCGRTGADAVCELDYCGPGGLWMALCTQDMCQCLLDDAVGCSCSLGGQPGNFCAGTPTCCPGLPAAM